MTTGKGLPEKAGLYPHGTEGRRNISDEEKNDM